MKKLLTVITFAITIGIISTNAFALTNQCKSASVGMWYHSDGTCNATSTNAIGLIYWVLNNGKNNVFNVMSLAQWTDTNGWDEAMTNCANYTTTGTDKGDWHLPTIAELIPMGLEYPCSGTTDDSCVSNGKFTTLNGKLTTDLTSSEYYWSSSRYGGNTGYRNVVRLSDGLILYSGATSTNYSARCVLAF